MQEVVNPYEAPKYSDEPVASQGLFSDRANQDYYFTTTTLKLTVMSVCTFGLYELFWFYHNWQSIKSMTGKNIMPFWRACFAPLFSYSCFKHIEESSTQDNIGASLPVGVLAVAYFVVQSLWRLPDPFWLASMFSFMVLIPVNNAALNFNKQQDSEFRNNSSFSVWNCLGILLGAPLFVLSIIGSFLPEV